MAHDHGALSVKLALSLLVSLMVLALPGLGHAKDSVQPLSGEQLQAICSSQAQTDQTVCRFYITGVAAGIKLGLYMAHETPAAHRPCIPDNATGSKLESIVKAGMARDFALHPALSKYEAPIAISAVLADAYPCSSTR